MRWPIRELAPGDSAPGDSPGAKCRRSGAAIIGIVLAMLVINLIIIGMVHGGARDQDLTVHRMQTLRAFYAAEAGQNMAIRELMLDIDADGDYGIGSISNDGNAGNNPTFGGGGSASVWGDASIAGDASTLRSYGSAGQARRRVEGTINGPAENGPGLNASYFIKSTAPSGLSDIAWTGAPSYKTSVSKLNMASASGQGWPGGPTNNWGKRFTGQIAIAQGGSWTFYTNSDEGSKLWINGTLVVDNDGLHTMQTRSGSIALTAGTHAIEVQVFERTGTFGLIVYWSGPGVPSQTVIPASAFTR